MAQKYSISLPDELGERVDEETQEFSDNRSALFQEALREYFGMETEQ